ncbi:hypothetical protein QBC46DRAFT_425562 [Diplogelasinospora grovesii]|uniref:Uncharacterized protein n=1 Tax=Diplogelasinospora grovesii TaxID=303347 RepID=A0AAN6MWK8_9PEZI|nr:hypothetical protein QBC46DRAFT_425562 [Diplogelasinospora grovesii]
MGGSSTQATITMATTTSGPQKQPPPMLLRLSPHIRRCIYLHAGLASWDGRPYTFDLHGRNCGCGDRTCESNRRPQCGGLMLSCRTLHAEAAALLYSANRFTLYYSHRGSLEPLRALTAPSLASLATLKIVLNEASCHSPARFAHGEDCCFADRLEGRRSGIAPGSSCQTLHGAMLSEWHSTAAYLSSRVGPGRLELLLVCDVDHEHERGLEAGKLAVAPLLLLPRLRNCHVRLCKTPDARLQQLAQDVVLQTRRIAAPHLQPPSTRARTTFASLPRELRLRILEYTDLITPNKEVAWSRQQRGYLPSRVVCSAPDFGHCRGPGIHSGHQFYRCWDRHEPGNWRYRPWGGCFCRRYHSAFSSACRCWAPPGPALFLVCRTLCWDAQFVFFSGNRFVVHDFDDIRPWRVPELQPEHPGPGAAATGYYPYERFAASQFLRDVVPARCLANLRFVELVFPPYPHQVWPRTAHAAAQDWWATVDWVRDKINAPALTVRVVVADDMPGDPRMDRVNITYPEGEAILRTYVRILRPPRRLGDDGLAGFYADFILPWSSTRAIKNIWLRGGIICERWKYWERGLKARSERYVMRDRYESLYANGKEEPAQSVWRRLYEQPG